MKFPSLMVMAFLLAMPHAGWAHAVALSPLEYSVQDNPRTLVLELQHDVDSLLLDRQAQTLAREDRERLLKLSDAQWQEKLATLKIYFAHAIDVWVGEHRVEPVVVFPEAQASLRAFPGQRVVYRVALSDNDRTFWLKPLEKDLGNLLVQKSENQKSAELVLTGERSRVYSLSASIEVADRRSAFGRYLKLGFEHILPKGLDHILFIVCLFLAARSWRPLLWQVTAFTLAHSVTLGLSMANIVALSPRIVEPLIAVSILVMAVDNIVQREMRAWRKWGVFLFGLLHGLGFAGVLREIGIPKGDFALALVGFNLGVELGQIAVLAMAFAVLGAVIRKPWYRQRVVMPLSAMMAGVALFWTMQRLLG